MHHEDLPRNLKWLINIYRQTFEFIYPNCDQRKHIVPSFLAFYYTPSSLALMGDGDMMVGRLVIITYTQYFPPTLKIYS